MVLFARTRMGKVFVLEYSDTVLELKTQIVDKSDGVLPLNSIDLIGNGIRLRNDEKLSDMSIANESTLHIIILGDSETIDRALASSH